MAYFIFKGKLNKFVLSLMVAAIISAAFLASSSRANAASGTVTLTGGSLSLTAPGNFAFTGVTLDGLSDKNTTGTFTAGVNDPTGTNAGWKLSATFTPLTDASSHTLPAAQILTGNDIAVNDTNGATPASNTITYPYTFPDSTSSIFYNADVNTGQGTHTYVVTAHQLVPKNSYVGAYTATLTVELAAGPA